MTKFIASILFLLVSYTGTAQIISSMSVSEDTIQIGDEIDVYYKLVSPKKASINGLGFSVLDSLDSLTPTSSADTSSVPYYAEIDWQAPFTNYENKVVPFHLVKKKDLGTKYEYRDTFKATFWDLGFYELLHPNIFIDSSSIEKEIMRLETPTVFVSPPLLQNPDTTSVILPIKDILRTEKSWKDNIKIILFFLLPLLIALLIVYLYANSKDKKKIVEVPVAPKEPAHVIALRKLANLQKNEEWKKGQVKKYQSELTYTIREYLENRYNINALESTTYEITQALASNDLDIKHKNDLEQILQIADLVKFAKAKPDEDVNEAFLRKAQNFVEQTQQVILSSENEEDAG